MAYPIRNPNDPVLASIKQSLGLNQPPPKSEIYPNAVKIPLYGEIQFVRDKDGLMLLSVIVAYWVYGVWSSYYVIIEPHWSDGLIPNWIVYCKFIELYDI